LNAIKTNVNDLLQVQGVKTVSYRPLLNACVERLHRTINEMLTRYIHSNVKTWDGTTRYVVYVYNAALHASTGFSLYFLMFGSKVNVPLTFVSQAPAAEILKDFDDFIQQVQEHLHEAFEFIRDELKCNFERNKRM
jgi:hypothetical protein